MLFVGPNQFSISYHYENFTHSQLRKFLIKVLNFECGISVFKGFPMVYFDILHVILSTIQFENHLNSKSPENQLKNLRCYQNYTKTESVWQQSWTSESYQNCTNFFHQNLFWCYNLFSFVLFRFGMFLANIKTQKLWRLQNSFRPCCCYPNCGQKFLENLGSFTHTS